MEIRFQRHERPKLFYKSKKRIAKKIIGIGRYHALVKNLNIQIGDIVGICSGYNCYVKDVVHEYDDCGFKRGRYLREITIADEFGIKHCISHCVYRKWTKEEIAEVFTYVYSEGCSFYVGSLPAFIAKHFNSGRKVFDENGCLLPEIYNEYEAIAE